MAKNPLYDHCNVITEINKEENTVAVKVDFKQHVLQQEARVRYTSSDISNALSSNGTPVAEVITGTNEMLDNRTTKYLSAKYLFSLVPKPVKASPVSTSPVSTGKKSPRVSVKHQSVIFTKHQSCPMSPLASNSTCSPCRALSSGMQRVVGTNEKFKMKNEKEGKRRVVSPLTFFTFHILLFTFSLFILDTSIHIDYNNFYNKLII